MNNASIGSAAAAAQGPVERQEPPVDDGFCFDLCLPPLPDRGSHDLASGLWTRTYFFVTDEEPSV